MLVRLFGRLVALNTFLIKACAAVIAALLGGIVVVMIVSVVMRYGFGSPFSWSDDLCLIFLVWMTLLGLVVGMRPGHLAVEGVLHLLPFGLGRLVMLATQLAILAMSVVVMWYSLAFVQQGMARIVPSMDWMRQGYIYAAIPVGFALVIPASIENALRPFVSPAPHDGEA